MIQSDEDKLIETCEEILNCSCCGVGLENKTYSPYTMINPSWGVLDYTQKGNSITEAGDDYHIEREIIRITEDHIWSLIEMNMNMGMKARMRIRCFRMSMRVLV
ncbi:unnamed protein product [Ilex paraguariensis]|uniref:Uncharacterized protein n=1 Tax=Ilex paraguariensis TaxID=185542 RepID=A0ABC8UH38_9AQUA